MYIHICTPADWIPHEWPSRTFTKMASSPPTAKPKAKKCREMPQFLAFRV